MRYFHLNHSLLSIRTQLCCWFGGIQIYKHILSIWTKLNRPNWWLHTLYLEHQNLCNWTVHLDNSVTYIWLTQIYITWPPNWQSSDVKLYGPNPDGSFKDRVCNVIFDCLTILSSKRLGINSQLQNLLYIGGFTGWFGGGRLCTAWCLGLSLEEEKSGAKGTTAGGGAGHLGGH